MRSVSKRAGATGAPWRRTSWGSTSTPASASSSSPATGRGRPPRPWVGLYPVPLPGGVGVSGRSPIGPALRAGFRRGDRIVRVNGVAVASQEEFYEQLWARRAGDLIELAVQRDNKVRIIAVPSVDRHRLYPVR